MIKDHVHKVIAIDRKARPFGHISDNAPQDANVNCAHESLITSFEAFLKEYFMILPIVS